MRVVISSWNQYSMVGNSLGLWVWELVTALGGVPGHTSSWFWGGSKCAFFVAFVDLYHSYSAIRSWGPSLAGNGKGISRKARTREGKLLPPVKGQARVRMKMESGHCRVRRVEMERGWILTGSKGKVHAPRTRACDKLCLLCDFNKEPLPRVPRASVSTQSPGHGENAVPLLCCFVFSEVQQPTDRTTSPCFWFPAYSRPEDQKSSWKVLPGEKHESISYEIIRNTRCEGAEDCKIIFLFYPVLCNQKSSLDSWGRGKAGEPVGETESN